MAKLEEEDFQTTLETTMQQKQIIEPWQRLTSSELIWYHESTVNDPMVITIYISIATEATKEFLFKKLAPLLLKHPRFKSCINPETKRFETIPEFLNNEDGDLESILGKYVEFQPHISEKLSEDERHEEFLGRLNEIMSSYIPIGEKDVRGLLWRAYVIPQFSDKFPNENRPGYSTLVFNVHHCISDGVGLLKFLVSDVVDSNTADSEGPSKADGHQQHPEQLLVPTKHLDKNRNQKGGEAGSQIQENFIPEPPNPKSPVTFIRDFFSSIYRSGIATTFPERRNALNRTDVQPLKHCYITKSTDTTPCLKIPHLKKISKMYGISINDLIYTAFSNGMTKYLQMNEKNEKLLRHNLRCSISVNQTVIEKKYDVKDVGNYLALVPLPLHNKVGDLENYKKKLVDCIQTMRFLKRSYYVHLCLQMVKLFTLLPSKLVRPVWLYFTKGATTFISNVPGPRSEVSICNGTSVNSLMFLLIVGGYMGSAVAIMSYNDSLRIGVSTDRSTIKNPKVIVELIRDELNDLCNNLLAEAGNQNI